jgi:16S rRNA (guanine527-N7)-methyltransferase
MTDYPKTTEALALLGRRGFTVEASSLLTAVETYRQLSSTWNLSAKLMSATDLAERFDDHVADSLSLAPYVQSPLIQPPVRLVDIGSGVGFPAIPLKLLITGLPIVLVERSAKKCAFLGQVVSRLGLSALETLESDFELLPTFEGPTCFTARATENPRSLDAAILRRLNNQSWYLAQRAAVALPAGENITALTVVDEFSQRGLRRGKLHVVGHSELIEKFHVELCG